MIRFSSLLCLIIFWYSHNAFTQDISKAEISWLDTVGVLNEKQLDQATFTEQITGVLEARSYYYVKVSQEDSIPEALPLLSCWDLTEVEYLIEDKWVSTRDLGWSPHTFPLLLDFPDSIHQKSYFYLRCYNYEQKPLRKKYFYWVNQNYYEKEFLRVSEISITRDILPNSISTGIIVAFILFFSVLYISNSNQKLYLDYVFYLIPLAIYLFHRSNFVLVDLMPSLHLTLPYWFTFTNYPIQVIFHISYTIFTFSFLNAKEDYPLYYKVGRVMIALASVFFIILSIGMYLQPFATLWQVCFQIERLLVSLFSLWANFYVITNRKNRMALIIAFGSLIFLSGAWGAFFYHMNLMRLGAIIEVIFFSYGIGYKINLERIEKDEIKTALINQLQEKEALQKKYNTELEQEVKVRSEELIEKAKQIEEEKKQKLKAQLDKKLEATKMVAMRSQMNPHFLFNSLNSIRHLIIRNKTTEAYDYLTKFAALMRAVLENAEKDAVLLSTELEIINTYISLEKLRFNDDFKFEVTVNSQALAQEIYVPPLLIQPFLENAIIHGLAYKKADKLLLLAVDIHHNKVCIKVEDNGIGRKEKNGYPTEKKHKSMAINIAKERLEVFTSYHSQEALPLSSISIQDKIDDGGDALGTVITIVLPLVKKSV